ncbi:OmpA family protein [Spirillospora sp. CA-294931]|uniref:OmpA family protein n=1 Tax=Spirillospora sp. CA-294931 TaxID=3240042 RepID=UPI003D8DB213
MPARRLAVQLAVPLTGLLLASGCSDSDKAGKSDPPRAKGDGKSESKSATPSPETGGKPVKEGWFGAAQGLHATVEIKGVERQSGKAVLKYSVTSKDTAAKSVPFAPAILDPVGRKLYKPSAPAPAAESFAPGATREMTAEYPALPASAQKVTVLTQGTAGEFTGVPVTGTGDAPGGGQPSGGSGNPLDLYDITEGEIKDVTSSGSDVKMNLRSDVMFAFNSAKLSSQAKQILDQAAAEIKQKADPQKRPLTFNGHTDSKGSDQYNLKLSRDRAETVSKELKNRLGGTFKYSAHGKGEAELIAKEGGKDDAKARARNRRVEISYVVRQEAPGATTSTTAAADGRGGAVTPAAFRAQDGQTVASRFGRFDGAKRRLDVKPFYRDGAYLVAVWEMTNEGPGTTPPEAAYPHKDYPGGFFTSFSVVAPNGKDVYRAVRIGQAASGGSAAYVDPGRATFRTGANEPVRGFAYIPMPPGNPTTVTFDGGPFGNVNNVPVTG